VIAEVGGIDCGPASEVLDAGGSIVTPAGWDVITHYGRPGQLGHELAPSSHNGATTVVMGNCGDRICAGPSGAGKDADRTDEGVEDIPGTGAFEGIEMGQVGRASEYMDYIGAVNMRLIVRSANPRRRGPAIM